MCNKHPRAAVESAVAVQADVEFNRSALNAEKVFIRGSWLKINYVYAMQYKLYISNKKCPGRIMKYNSLSFLEIMTDCPTDLPTKHLRRWSLPIFIKGHGISYKWKETKRIKNNLALGLWCYSLTKIKYQDWFNIHIIYGYGWNNVMLVWIILKYILNIKSGAKSMWERCDTKNRWESGLLNQHWACNWTTSILPFQLQKKVGGWKSKIQLTTIYAQNIIYNLNYFFENKKLESLIWRWDLV